MSDEIETLGSYLRRERKKRSISIEQISYATRISIKMLVALEEDNHTALPAQPFVRGYLQAFAKCLRLDPQDILLRYQHHLATNPCKEESAKTTGHIHLEEKRQESQRLVVTVVVFVLLLLGSGSYLFLKGKLEQEKAKTLSQAPVLKNPMSIKKRPAPPVVTTVKKELPAPKPVPPVAENSTAPADPPKKAEEVKKEAAVEKSKKDDVATNDSTQGIVTPDLIDPIGKPRKYNLSLKAKEDVWIRFQTDNEEIKDLILRKGRTLMIRANRRIKMFSGNLDGLIASFNGKSMETLVFGERKRSVVLPASEVDKVSLPLFPATAKPADSAIGTAPTVKQNTIQNL